ncbi:hypothetical protein [Sphingobacterium sp. UBA6645]|uniref:hypothetical protein n=1 Tax=Sphingobacterium sp. UBA6645 TaxID=1947511 RepID=UPI0025E3872A|nr:hypothetical protein [Sphingobacterium sp. UBA6645]
MTTIKDITTFCETTNAGVRGAEFTGTSQTGRIIRGYLQFYDDRTNFEILTPNLNSSKNKAIIWQYLLNQYPKPWNAENTQS